MRRRPVDSREHRGAPIVAASFGLTRKRKLLVETTIVAQVAIPVPLDRTFDYAVPAEFETAARRGARVLVPFSGRLVTGVVVSTDPPHTDSALKDVVDVLDDEPAVTEELLQLAEWISGYYFCGLGEALRAALPAGIEVESERRVRATEPGTSLDPVTPQRPTAGTGAGAVDDGQSLLKAIVRHETGVSVAQLRREHPAFSASRLALLERRGLVSVDTVVRKPRVKIKKSRFVQFAPRANPDVLLGELVGEKQKAIVKVLVGLRDDGSYPAGRTELLDLAEASVSSLKSLADKGVVVETEREVARHAPDSGRTRPGPPRVDLHEEQAVALERILESVSANEFRTFLLHGITGSGKTEVYIRALTDVLQRGKSGIILVPEIALTPQTVSRFTAHFGDEIAVLHSRMAAGERYDSWRYIRDGRHRVVIGPRSAILAPVANLGLVVVDEEHEHTYKQFEPAPRYHARDVAVVRAQLNSAVCVLGSATPSLESYANATSGKYGYLRMRNRAPTAGETKVALPSTRIVDLTEEKKRHRLEGILSGQLRSAIASRLRSGEQTILLQNRRGYAPTVECTACGWAPVCPDCSVSMTYHKSGRLIRCHYCGRTERNPKRCANCGSAALLNIGVGTQRVEEELASLFPDARILRMDFDTTSRKNAHHSILERFGQGRADILLGTQMVAKGLDFERVTLVGVVDADTGLLFPDFRAEERTFQLLTQVAGRAGRGSRAGEVLLQTRNAGSPAITFALAHDYDGFAEYALKSRAALNYPPFGRLVAVYFRGPEEGNVRALSEDWVAALRSGDGALTVLGPHPAFVARMRNQFRYVALIKVPQKYGSERLRAVLRRAEAVKAPARYFVVVDIDAMGLF